jgi:hypothetical protein
LHILGANQLRLQAHQSRRSNRPPCLSSFLFLFFFLSFDVVAKVAIGDTYPTSSSVMSCNYSESQWNSVLLDDWCRLLLISVDIW